MYKYVESEKKFVKCRCRTYALHEKCNSVTPRDDATLMDRKQGANHGRSMFENVSFQVYRKQMCRQSKKGETGLLGRLETKMHAFVCDQNNKKRNPSKHMATPLEFSP